MANHYVLGDIFRNTGLARFFEIIARDGLSGARRSAEAFYRGEIAERIVKFSQANGGRFSIRDFRDHTANWVEPVSTNYRGYDVWELPPNGQGIAALQMLNILEHFDIASMKPSSTEHLQILMNIIDFGYSLSRNMEKIKSKTLLWCFRPSQRRLRSRVLICAIHQHTLLTGYP